MRQFHLIFLAAPLIHAQTFEVTPSRVLVDEVATIRATGLQPNERVTIKANLRDGADIEWRSHADFIADSSGAVDTAKQDAIAGSYKEASAMGLVWAMTPESKNVARYVPPRNSAPQLIDFELTHNNGPSLKAKLEQIELSPLVQRIPVREDGLHGVLLVPRESEKHAGVLVVGGSEGGLSTRKAAWLANHGYAALALAYFHFEGLPEDLSAIPLEYFGKALTWLSQRPEIDANRIGVMGTSRGGELALQLGSMFPRIKSVVAYVPANYRHRSFPMGARAPYAWTWNGQPLAFAGPRGPMSSPAQRMLAEIEVEHTKGPILMISGESDGVWESSSMADSAANRLKHEHFAFDVVNLKYPHAGHGAGRPEIVPAWLGAMHNQISGMESNPGGTPKGNAESSLDAIPKVLDFLHKSLSAPVTAAQ